MGSAQEAYERARAAIDAGRHEEALAAVEEAFRLEPTDAPSRELYLGLLLAKGVRLAAQARDLRRSDIAQRRIEPGVEFEDSPAVREAFEKSLAAFDAVLVLDPGHAKALMMKASTLHRFDREHRRAEALELLRRIEAAHPENRQVRLVIRKVERACEECSDTGFCPICGGRGTRTILRIRQKCGRCWGQGICLRCGVL